MPQIIIKPDQLHKLTLIEYPAVVNDQAKAIRCLGGMEAINKVLQDPSGRRLELRFRPGDIFCKPTCSESRESHGILLRLKFRKKKGSTTGHPQLVSSEPVGIYKSVYRFESLCDFQYLPVDGDGSNIHDRVVPSSVLDTDYFTRPTSLMVPPLAFSRIDTAQAYCYRRPPTKRAERPPGRVRQRVGGQTVSHLDADMPKAPPSNKHHLEELIRQRNGQNDRKIVQKMFDDRPVMSRAYILYHTGIDSDRLRSILPLVAYYFITGPWRNMWTRLGYDPRRDPDAWKYQIIDYRTRNAVLKNKMVLRRALSVIPYRSMSKGKNISINTQKLTESQLLSRGSQKPATERSDSMFRFRAGTLPGARQIFYQYCDIELSELSGAFRDGLLGDYCEMSGWVDPSVEDQVRNLITHHVDAYLKSVNDKEAGDGKEQEELEAEVDYDTEEADDDVGESDAEADEFIQEASSAVLENTRGMSTVTLDEDMN